MYRPSAAMSCVAEAKAEVVGDVQRDRHQAQRGRAEELEQHDERLLAGHRFEERAPQRLDGPGPAQQVDPSGDLGVLDAQVLEQDGGDRHHDEERHALCEVQRGDPGDG
jgi:hypothetical protein